MLSNKDKLERYMNEFPDQVYVNQSEFFDLDDYDVEELGVAMAETLDSEMAASSGSYTRHEKCKRDCLAWTALVYENKLDIYPEDELYQLSEELFEFAEDVEDQFTAVEVFMPFISEVNHGSELLESLHDNLEVEGFFQVVVNGPEHNRFWISKLS